MKGYDAGSYGDHIADRYDAVEATYASPARAAAAALGELASSIGGRLLELGIGTGRVALPLAAAGFDVVGIEASAAMIEQLRAKPGSEALTIVAGDMADVAADGTFGLAYVVFNTLFFLPTQADQARCFANVAAHLDPGGLFVVEAFVPDPALYEGGGRLHVRVDLEGVGFEVARHSRTEQRLTVQNVDITSQGIRLQPVVLRYAWPSELDLMARLAGLELVDRWRGWDRATLTDTDPSHVSVWRKPR